MCQVVFQRGLATAQHHVEDRMVAQVAERSGVAVAASEEMLIDAEHLRAWLGAALGGAQAEEILKPAFHCGAADPFPLPQPATADAVEMLPRYAAPERLAGTPARQNPWKSLPEGAATP